MSDTKQRKPSGYLAGLLVTLVCVLVAYLLLINRQFIVDQVSVWQYVPTQQVAAFTERTSMSDIAKFYFYASQPSLDNRADFNQKCQRKEQHTAILGCYDGRRIYIYNIDNQQLDGIRAVTAAHEMLHAAYDRLSDAQRQALEPLLDAEYEKLKDNLEFNDRVAFYERTQPGERYNELHSMIGTEITPISPALEAHYATYFTDRADVTGLHAQYAGVFADLQARGDALSDQLTTLGNSIEQDSLAYNTNVQRLNDDIEEFNQRANGDGFSSQSQFNQQRQELLDRAQQLDADRRAINDAITTYGELREELAGIASQSEALNNSIDSSLAPAPSL